MLRPPFLQLRLLPVHPRPHPIAGLNKGSAAVASIQRWSALVLQFDIPATYPTTAPEIEIPELEGKTAKMYRGGKICLTIHFKPLWAKNR